MAIYKNDSPTLKAVEAFLGSINFSLPDGFIDFLSQANGAELNVNDNYVLLWPLTDLVQLNKEYNVQEYAPEFFLFGSNGGETAYAIEKATGNIFEMPFIGMSKDEAIFKSKTFTNFIKPYMN